MGETRWIDAEAASRRLNVSVSTLRRWCRRGLVTRWRTVGLWRRYQVASDALDALYAEQVRESVCNPSNPGKTG